MRTLVKLLKFIKEKPYFNFLKKTFSFLFFTALLYLIFHFREILANQIINLWTTSPTFYSSLATGFTGVIIALVTISKQRKLSREKNSLDFCSTYKHSDSVIKAWGIIMQLRKEAASEGGKIRSEELTKDETDSLNLLFNEWERCANAIRSDLYEDLFLYRIYASTLLGLYRDFSFYLIERQENNCRYFCDFIWLCERWSDRRAKEISSEVLLDIKKEQSRLRGNIEENVKFIDWRTYNSSRGKKKK